MYDYDFYESMANAYFKNTRWSRLRLKQVEQVVKPGECDRILDLGCGMGTVSHFCAQRGANVIGVDITPEAIEFASNLFSSPKLEFHVRDVCNLYGFPDQHFDKAVAADLVEHIDQATFEQMLSEVKRVLKSFGLLFIYTPNPSHIVELMKGKEFILKQNPTHIDVKSTKRIISTLLRSGFEIKNLYYTPSFLPFISVIEQSLNGVPKIGPFFRYRICVDARKSEL